MAGEGGLGKFLRQLKTPPSNCQVALLANQIQLSLLVFNTGTIVAAFKKFLELANQWFNWVGSSTLILVSQNGEVVNNLIKLLTGNPVVLQA